MLNAFRDMVLGGAEPLSPIDQFDEFEVYEQAEQVGTTTTYGSFDTFERAPRGALPQPPRAMLPARPAAAFPFTGASPMMMVAYIKGLHAHSADLRFFSDSFRLLMESLALQAGRSLRHEWIERIDKDDSALLQKTKFTVLHVFRIANCNADMVNRALRNHIPPRCAIRISVDGTNGMQAIFAGFQTLRQDSILGGIARKLSLLDPIPPSELQPAEEPTGEITTEFQCGGLPDKSPLKMMLDMPDINSQKDLVALVSRAQKAWKEDEVDRATLRAARQQKAAMDATYFLRA